MSPNVMNTAFIAGVGVLELALVLLIVLVIVGGRRLPALGRQLGEGMRGFKDSVTRGTDSQWEDEDTARADVPALLARAAGEETPVDGEVMRERS
jgi:sec-independent protein translocase protein TatA